MRAIVATVMAGTLLMGGCSSDSTTSSELTATAPSVGFTSIPDPPAPPEWSPAVDVPWEDCAPLVRERIDQMAADGDCAGLQAEFDTADANNDATRERTGHNNADLMGYIDEWMDHAGCYDQERQSSSARTSANRSPVQSRFCSSVRSGQLSGG